MYLLLAAVVSASISTVVVMISTVVIPSSTQAGLDAE